MDNEMKIAERGAVLGKAIKVLVIEDQALVRAGLCSLLAQLADFEVVGSCGAGAEGLALATALAPDVVVADFFLGGGLEGTDLIRSLRAVSPQPPRVLTLSLHDEASVGDRAVRAGSRGFLTKEETPNQLVDAVRQVAAGKYFVSDDLLARLNDLFSGFAEKPNGVAGLSERELQVFRLLGAGLEPEVIAARLGISPRTVGSHRETLKRKLGIQTSERLQKHAREWVIGAMREGINGAESSFARRR
jgi:DNA-binding NarL/FixJ family response regulator